MLKCIISLAWLRYSIKLKMYLVEYSITMIMYSSILTMSSVNPIMQAQICHRSHAKARHEALLPGTVHCTALHCTALHCTAHERCTD